MSSVTRLCKEILLEDFGPFVSVSSCCRYILEYLSGLPNLILTFQQVGRQMLLKGRLTLADLVRFTSLPQRQVRECLVVLVQHGITYFSESPEGKNEPTYYTTDAEKIMMRLRMGSILREVDERFGNEVNYIL